MERGADAVSLTEEEMLAKFDESMGSPKKYGSREPEDYKEFFDKIMAYSDEDVEKIARRFKKTMKEQCVLQRKYFKEFKDSPHKLKLKPSQYAAWISDEGSPKLQGERKRREIMDKFGDYIKFAHMVMQASASELAAEFQISTPAVMQRVLNELGVSRETRYATDKVFYLRRLIFLLLEQNRRLEAGLERRR